ncbi:MAG: MFS transporter [Lysobacterales bacterium 14-68-21]|jgi:predicted MFS family arabinose efflux permease|nr:MAG: MFS transporter [Xanthomonadales bacterium 15-68-25]OZB63789.1 MAG: MFS transporter [Xanthomonadales bacterium 14-68-21]
MSVGLPTGHGDVKGWRDETDPCVTTAQTPVPPLTRSALFAMALACGTAVANIYYNQPMLGMIAARFPAGGVAGLVATLTQVGYALGLLLLLPLGDLYERRRLIVVQFVAVAVASAGAALSTSAWSLLAASLALGAASTVAQQIVPFVAILAEPSRRGAAIGFVMSGLLTGILFSRTLAGFVAEHFGWQTMFWVAVPIALGSALLMRLCLPVHRPNRSLHYGALLASLVGLWRGEPVLRRAGFTQGMLFAAFTAFWTILALRLQQPAFHLGPDVAGLFGVVGAVGVAMAPLAGRMADRRGPYVVIALGTSVALLAWLVFGLWESVIGMVVGVMLLDFGVQVALVSHQHLIYGLHPEYKSRLNTVFMTTMFFGGSLGSIGAAFAWHHLGWFGVSLFGGALALVAMLSQWRAHRLQAATA